MPACLQNLRKCPLDEVRLLPAESLALGRRLGGEGHPARIPWRQVVKIGLDVKVAVEAEQSPASRWERWIRDHIVSRIPGA